MWAVAYVLTGVVLGICWERARAAAFAELARRQYPALPPATAREVRRDRRDCIADISVAMARPTRTPPLALPSLHDFDHEETRDG